MQHKLKALVHLLNRPAKPPVISPHAGEAFLKAVQFQNLTGVVDQISGKGNTRSVPVDQVSQASVGMAGGVQDLDAQVLPVEAVPPLESNPDWHGPHACK